MEKMIKKECICVKNVLFIYCQVFISVKVQYVISGISYIHTKTNRQHITRVTADFS